MSYELTIFSVPNCIHCDELKEELDKLGIIYFLFDVLENRNEWLEIIDNYKNPDIIPTMYLLDNVEDTGQFFIPGKDFFNKDEAIELIKKYFY